MSMRDAFAKLGITSSDASAPLPPLPVAAPTTIPASPIDRPDDEAVRYGAGLCRLGAGDAAVLARRLEKCDDGTGSGRAQWESWVAGRLNAQPQKLARELEVLGLARSLTSKGVPSWGLRARAVVDALVGGYAAEFNAQQAAEAKQAAGLAFPELGEDEADDAYRARVNAWADELPRGVLLRLAPARWGDSPDVQGAIEDRISARWEKAQAAEQARKAADLTAFLADFQRQIDAGVSLTDLVAVLDAAPYDYVDAALQRLRGSAQGWANCGFTARGGWTTPTGEAPPQGWAQVSEEGLLRAVLPRHGDSHSGAVAYLSSVRGNGALVRREEVVAVLRGDTLQRFASTGFGGVHPPEHVTHVTTSPDPVGWAEPSDQGLVWCGPEVFAALTRARIRAAEPGNLDVRRVMSHYGRHPERNFPRFSVAAWRTWLTVGVDDVLGSALDDLALLLARCPARIPPGAFQLHAECRKTSSGGLRVAATSTGAPGALIVVAGGTSGRGRHGRAGEDITVRADSSALAASVFGGSNGGGQTASKVFAELREGRPLLLDNGVGYQFSRAGSVERVPGLADGRPGASEVL